MTVETDPPTAEELAEAFLTDPEKRTRCQREILLEAGLVGPERMQEEKG